MSRPKSDTVDYYSHDTQASNSKTLIIIEGEYGLTGYAFWFKLLEWLGHSDGFYYDARDSDDLEFLCRKFGVDLSTGESILGKLALLNAIDPILWDHKVIWSDNFVSRFSEVYKKRGRGLPAKPYFCDGNCNHRVPKEKFFSQKSPKKPKKGQFSPQKGHKVKESKVKESKVKESKDNNDIIVSESLSSEKDIFTLYQEEFGKITEVIRDTLLDAVEHYGEDQVQRAMKKAVLQGSRRWAYVEGILKNWEEEKPAVFDTVSGVKPNPAAEEIWGKTLAELKSKVSGPNYRVWLEKTRGISFADGVFVIGAPNTSVAEHLNTNYKSLIEIALIGLTRPGVQIEFKVIKKAPEPNTH